RMFIERKWEEWSESSATRAETRQPRSAQSDFIQKKNCRYSIDSCLFPPQLHLALLINRHWSTAHVIEHEIILVVAVLVVVLKVFQLSSERDATKKEEREKSLHGCPHSFE
ncbi:hypothetical protein PENTCL1PPCAC_2655, partial [Pristionchus entomophagus]